jgi:hypothetical protein
VKKRLIVAAVLFGIALLAGLSIGFRSSLAVNNAPLDENDRVVLSGNVHPKARAEFDTGPTAPSLPMKRMILLLKIAPEKQAELDRLLTEQQTPSSPNFHRWLTPEEFGKKFGRSPEEVATVKNWLTTQGFTIDETAKGGTWINFSGTVADVERAFHANMHDYNVDGNLHHANSTDPSIPRALADVVAGPVTLHNFFHKPSHSTPRPIPEGKRKPHYTNPLFPGSPPYALAPGDFAVIYDVNSIYGMGYDGTGVPIAVVERTHPKTGLTKWATFRSNFGLPANTPNVILNGPDPGDLGAGEDSEIDLDVEWSNAVATGATIDVVISESTETSDGSDLSAQYIVDNNLAPVVSDCFGTCEPELGSSSQIFYYNIWEQAACQGMTVFVVTGDTGAYACTDAYGYPIGSPAVNGLASTPYNIAVGGTSLSSESQYWNSVNNADYVSALGYDPEVAWNDWTLKQSPDYEAASGGGASIFYPKPAWQVSPGVPTGDNTNHRYLPDVSLNADDVNVPYSVYTCTNYSGPCGPDSWSSIGGTSGAAPPFAGIMAMIVQSAGGEPLGRQGNANVAFYQLGNAQYSATPGANQVFHDITSGNNYFGKGLSKGYTCGPGYDPVTGLGSVDAANLLLAFQEGGSLTVTIGPAPAVSAGAMWNVDGGPWQSGGGPVSGPSVGSHTIAFSPVSGWKTPASQTVVMTYGQPQTVSGTYTLLPPTVSIGSPSAAATAAGPVTYTLTYTGLQDTVTLSAASVTLNKTGTAAGTVTSVAGSGNTYTVTISSISGDGTLGISITAGTASNAGGSCPKAGPSATFDVVNTAPTVSISGPSPAVPTSKGPVTYTLTYTGRDDSITLSAASVTLNNNGGNAGGTIAVSGTGNTRIVTISSLTGDGPLGISIAAGTASNVAGQCPAVGPSAMFEVITTPPAVSIGAPSVSSTISGPVAYTVNYTGLNDTITLSAAYVILNNAGGSAHGTVTVGGSGNTRTVTISSITGNGPLGIGISKGTASNLAGSCPASTPSATFIVDNSPPTISETFGTPAIPLNGSTGLSFTVTNPSTYTGITGVAFTDTLPAGLQVSTPNNLTGSCGGATITAAAGGNVVSLSGAALTASGTPGASCTFSVNVTGIKAGVQNNTTGKVTSVEGGTGGTASATLSVLAPPTISKKFPVTSIPLNGKTNLSFTLGNPNGSKLTGVGFSDALPAGLVVSNPTVTTGSCGGGTITAVEGTSAISLLGATLPAGISCTFSVSVTGIAAGVQNNTTGNVTSTEGGTGLTASASLSVIAPPTIGKSFGAPTIPLNGSTTLTFTLGNPNGSQLTGVHFGDTLPAGLVVSAPNGLVNTCGGIVTAAGGTGAIALAGATLPASGSCSLTVNVTGKTAGQKNNTTGSVASLQGGTGLTASAPLAVIAPPTISETFGTPAIPLNGTTSLSFTVTNPNIYTSITGVAFNDPLPAGLQVSTPNNLTGSCGGGTITAVAGTDLISLSGATLTASGTPGASCTFSVSVTGIAAGVQNNTTGKVTSTEGGTGGAASATLSVIAPPTISKKFAASSIPLNGKTRLSFTVGNPNTSKLTGVGFSDTLPPGLVISNPTGLAGACGGGTITAVEEGSAISLLGATLPAGTSCTFSVSVTGIAAGVQSNTTGNVTSTEGGTGLTASATLSVIAPISKSFDAPTIHISALDGF